MNDTMQSILNRRSHRAFLSDSLNPEDVKLVVEAGVYSPSAMNQQPWHFTVIENQQLLDELSYEAKEAAKNAQDKYITNLANNEKFHIFYNAPVAILVSIEQGKYEAEVDCAAASENMLIAAESLGLGSCWIGFLSFLFKIDKEKAKKYSDRLGIPEGYEPSHAIVLGKKKNVNIKAPERRENTVNYIK